MAVFCTTLGRGCGDSAKNPRPSKAYWPRENSGGWHRGRRCQGAFDPREKLVRDRRGLEPLQFRFEFSEVIHGVAMFS